MRKPGRVVIVEDDKVVAAHIARDRRSSGADPDP